jgi:hypothetical protein
MTSHDNGAPTETNPNQRNIRYLFKLINISKKGVGGGDSEEDSESVEEEEEEGEKNQQQQQHEEEEAKVEGCTGEEAENVKWLTLPEVVNVTLFGRTNPCLDSDSNDWQIKWSTNQVMPGSEKKIQLWGGPISEKPLKPKPKTTKGKAKGTKAGPQKKKAKVGEEEEELDLEMEQLKEELEEQKK